MRHCCRNITHRSPLLPLNDGYIPLLLYPKCFEGRIAQWACWSIIAEKSCQFEHFEKEPFVIRVLGCPWVKWNGWCCWCGLRLCSKFEGFILRNQHRDWWRCCRVWWWDACLLLWWCVIRIFRPICESFTQQSNRVLVWKPDSWTHQSNNHCPAANPSEGQNMYSHIFLLLDLLVPCSTCSRCTHCLIKIS